MDCGVLVKGRPILFKVKIKSVLMVANSNTPANVTMELETVIYLVPVVPPENIA